MSEQTEFGLQDIIIDLFNSLSAVRELSELNCQATSEKELLKNALSVLIQNQEMEQCSFFILNKEQNLVNVTGFSNINQANFQKQEKKPLQFAIGEGVIGLAAQTKILQHCRDCTNDARFVGNEDSDFFLGSIISVPVSAGNDEVIGVLNISHPEANHFGDWHIHLLEIYKNMLGQLITNYRLFQDMESLIAIRTEKLEKSLADLNTLKEHYHNISMIDQLTGLYNRRFFYEQADIALANNKRYGQSFCLLILDLDHFKQVNDNYGHGFGDRVLINVSTELQTHVRESDILVRFGGEEFVVIFNNTNCYNGEIFAERIRQKIEALEWDGKDDFSQTVSIGVFCQDRQSENLVGTETNIEKIINFADKALYAAKHQGRNRVVHYSELK